MDAKRCGPAVLPMGVRRSRVARSSVARGAPRVQPTVDEFREQGPRAGAVRLPPARKRGPQPYAIDHRGNHGRETLRLLGRDEFLERAFEVGQRAPLVDRLHPPQARHLQHLAPEREPRGAGAPVEFLRGEIGIDDGLDPRARGGDIAQARAHLIAHAPRERAEGGVQQTVLVAEIMGHQSGRHSGPAGNLRQRRAHKAHFG